MRSLFAVALLLPFLTGCSSLPVSPPPAAGKAVATLQEHSPNLEVSPTNKEIRCHIQMIDGVETGVGEKLRPGHHRVIVALGSNESEHVGDVDLLIPAAINYRLKAERNDEIFTLSLLEEGTGKVAATSSARVSQVMQFQVFVIQK